MWRFKKSSVERSCRDSSESGPSGRGVTVLFGSTNVIGPVYSITACLVLTK